MHLSPALISGRPDRRQRKNTLHDRFAVIMFVNLPLDTFEMQIALVSNQIEPHLFACLRMFPSPFQPKIRGSWGNLPFQCDLPSERKTWKVTKHLLLKNCQWGPFLLESNAEFF